MIRPPSNYDILKKINSNTPDFRELANCPYDEFVVFVYGHMRNTGIKNSLFNGCNYYGEGLTWGDNFILKNGPFPTHNHQPEPMAFELDDKTREKTLNKYKGASSMQWSRSGQIEGDLYGVPLRTLTQLDKYEENGNTVKRDLRWITLKHPADNGVSSLKAYMYIVDWDTHEEFYQHYGSLMSCNSYVEKAVDSKKDFRIYYFRSYDTTDNYEY